MFNPNYKKDSKKSVFVQNNLTNNGYSLPSEAIRQLQYLGFTKSDRVWLLALPAKDFGKDMVGCKRFDPGLVYLDPKDGTEKTIRNTYYLENGELYQMYGDKAVKKPLQALQLINDRGCGIYLRPNKGGNYDKQITEANTLFYECDLISKDEQWALIRNLESNLGIKAIVVESGKSLHPYFRIDQPITDLKVWREYQQRLILRQNSDPSIHNPSRLMRLAGYNHQKWDIENQKLITRKVGLVQESSDVTTLAAFDEILPFLPEPEVKAIGSSGKFTVYEGSTNGIRMLDLVEYQDGWNPSGRKGWGTLPCPVHTQDGQSHSIDHVHVNLTTGAFKAHCECPGNKIYHSFLSVAVDRGYLAPVQTEEQKKEGKTKTKENFKKFYTQFKGFGQYKPTHTQKNDRLVLPALKKKLTFISSACKTGKTTALVGEIKKRLARGERVIWLTYRNALAYQTCSKAGIPHIHEFNSDSDRVSYAKAFACCPDSLHLLQISAIKEPFFVVIDEADATLKHLLYGETMGEEHERKASHFRMALKRIIDMGGQIVLMEDSLTHTMIDQYRKIIGEAVDFDLVVNEAYLSKWIVRKIGGGSHSGVSEQIIRDIALGKTIALVADSQQFIEALDRLITTFNPKAKIIRVDSRTVADEETKEFMKSPDQVIDQVRPNAIFLSPTAESGVSIESEKIDVVYAYFTHSDPRQMVQMLERVRTDVDRYIYCKDYSTGAEAIRFMNPVKLLEQLKEAHKDTIHRCQLILKQKQFNQTHGLINDADPILMNLNMQDSDDDHRVFNEAYSWFKARENAAKAAPLTNLIEELTNRGIEIESLEDWQHDQGTMQDYKAARHEVEHDRACEVSGADESRYTVEEARKLKQSNSLSREDAAVVEKILLMDALPGYPVNDPEAVHYVLSNRGKNRKRATRLLHGIFPHIAYEKDTKYNVRKLQRSPMQMLHKSPNYGRQAGVDNALLPLMVRCNLETYTNSTPFIIEFSNLLVQYADELYQYTGQKFEPCRPEIRDENGTVIQSAITPIRNVNKYLKHKGFETPEVSRPGPRNNRVRAYKAVVGENMSEVLLALLERYKEELAQSKDSKAVSAGFNYLSLLLNPADTDQDVSEKRTEISKKLLNFIASLEPVPIAV